MAGEIVARFDKIHLFILDPVNPNNARRIKTTHEQKLNFVEETFENFVDCNIEHVSFPPRTKTEAVIDHVANLCAKVPDNEVAVIYYHGRAGEVGEEHSWRFEDYPKEEIDAYKLIDRLIRTNVNCLMLLDCYFPSRWPERWRPGTGTFEILSPGRPVEHVSGKKADNDRGDFTANVCLAIEEFVQGISGRYEGYEKPISIPELLKSRKDMSANPIAYRFRKTARDALAVGHRIVFDPEQIREDGKAKLVARQGAGRKTKADADEEGESEKEGLGQDDDDEGVGDMNDQSIGKADGAV